MPRIIPTKDFCDTNEIDKAMAQYESDIANHVQGKDARTLFSELKGKYQKLSVNFM